MEQILVKQTQLHGNLAEIKVADVVSNDGETLRVKIQGQSGVIVVNASDTLPIDTVAPGQARVGQRISTQLTKAYPTSPHSLSSRLY